MNSMSPSFNLSARSPMSPLSPISPTSPLSQTNYYPADPPSRPKIFSISKCFSNMFWWYNSNNKDIILSRMIKAILWTVIVQMIFLILFIFLVNFSLFHPLEGLLSAIKTSTSLTTWLLIYPLALLIAIEGLICSEDILLIFPYNKTNLQVIFNLFSIRNLFMITLHSISGGIIFWLYLTLLGGEFSSISISCGAEKCIQERSLFLRIGGFLMGICFFFKDYFFENKNLQFPVIQYYKFLQFKPKILQAIRRAMIDVLIPMIFIMINYYLYGPTLTEFFVSLYGYKPDSNPLISLFDYFNYHLMFNFWILSTMFMLTIYSVKIIFNLYFTEQTSFPVSQKYFTKEEFLLKNALSSEFPIIQHLGYLDFMNLAEKDLARREEVYTLSQPGGHPHNWNGILEQTLNLIDTYTLNLSQCFNDTSTICDFNLKIPQVAQTIPENEDKAMNKTIRNLTLDNSNMEFSYAEHLKNNRIEPFLKPQMSSKIVKQEPNIFQKMDMKFKECLNQIVQSLLNKPGFHFLFAKHPEAELRYYLLRAQPVIWALQALSQLAAASYNEDKYGIVQKDLAKIISSFLKLKSTIDKLQKAPFNSKRSYKNTNDVKMKLSLKSAVKRNLYRISKTFGSHVRDLSLNKEDLVHFEKFIMYKE